MNFSRNSTSTANLVALDAFLTRAMPVRPTQTHTDMTRLWVYYRSLCRRYRQGSTHRAAC